jgi:outer membrane protein OmpA-like peptidoglycan-associated protein
MRLLFRNSLLPASLLLCVARPSFAQQTNLDVERFKPAVTYDGFVNAEGSGTRYTDDPWEFGAFLNYGFRPLVTVDGDGDVNRKFVSGRLGADLLASVSLADPFAIGVGLPLYMLQSGDYSPSFAGLGDLRIVPKLRILDDRESFGLGLAVEVRAPTHTGDFSGGTRGVVVAPKLIADHRFLNGVRFGANIGATIRERTTFYNVAAASEFAYALALGYRFGGPGGKTELGAELLGGVGFVQSDKEEVPLEAFPYLKYDPSEEWELQGGVGVGILAGYGVPLIRPFFGVRYRPTSHDSDRDGVPDSRDKCVNEAEDRDGIHDTDGCPEEDEDSDGVPDTEDRCPNEKEMINGFEDDDGCPDEGPARVILEEGQIKILERVNFKTGSAELEEDSHSILNQVALTMKANKDVKRVRVEGHTDETGTRERNIQLSKERAASVREYLIRRGVKPNRLTSEGYGPDRPLAKGTDPDSLAKNRRVEFVVEQ